MDTKERDALIAHRRAYDDGEGLWKDDPSSISTWTTRISPLNPDPAAVNIEDIAHALARQCRYNGHCEGFISVARHSMWVSERLESQGVELALWGLLHDAAEAYLGDLVRPLKRDASLAVFLEAEARLDEVIADVFGLPWPMPPEVVEADRYVLLELELYDRRQTYFGDYLQDEAEFMDRYVELSEARAS